MNKSEEKGYAWLLKKGYTKEEIVFQRKGIDFICADGKGYEVKRLYGHIIWFHEGQLERIIGENNIVLVFDDDHKEPIAEIQSKELRKDKIISGIKVTIVNKGPNEGYVKKLIEMDEGIWKRFEKVAVAKFGLYGAITKGVNEAIKELVERGEKKE